MALKFDQGVFHTAATLQEAQDAADIERHGGIFRLEARPDLKRHPDLGESRLNLTRTSNTERANNGENDPQDPA